MTDTDVAGMEAVAIRVGKLDISGRIAPGFEAVAEAFARNFADHGEVGAACAVYRRGRPLVDLWGGLADPQAGKPWARDTIALVFSAAKGPTATCIHRLVESGQLDLDSPIADYWPEFGCNGKEAITPRMVLSHRAGLAAVDGELTLEEVLAWDPVVEAIARQAPNWKPGSQHGYHARSFGWILGELIRRITGLSAGQYLRRDIAEPLDLHYWVGLPAAQRARCAKLVPPQGDSDALAKLLGADSLTVKVMTGPAGLFAYDDMWNQADILSAELPSSNGVGDARSLARFYDALINPPDGARLLGSDQLAKARELQSSGVDAVILQETCFGLGFALQPSLAPGAGAACFGHPGAGGALAFADPEAEIGFAYVMNAMQFHPEGDPRTAGLVDGLYDCIHPS